MAFGSKILPKTLLARFMLIIIVPFLIGQLVLIFLFYDRHWYNISYYNSNIIANEVSSLVNMVNNEVHYTTSEEIKGEYLNLNYQVVKEKLPIKQPKLNEELQIFKNILNNKVSEKNIVKPPKDGLIVVIFSLDEEHIIYVYIHSKVLISPTTNIFIWWLVCLSIIMILTSLTFSRNQIRSILQLAEAADNFGRGNKVNFKPKGAQEIRKAGIAFLKMRDRIEKQIMARTQMLAMISHDLRTPLTRIRLQIELIKQPKLKQEIIDDLQTMNQMISSYLEFAKGEGGEEFQTINLDNWFKEFLATKWKTTNIKYIANDKELITNIKVGAFQRAISNLISNSVKYATIIRVSLYIKENNIIIDIEDNGPGIPDNEKPFIFKPFYRIDKSRNVKNDGSIGLGLTITKEIINGLNGTISLENSENLKGLCVRIILPKINNKQLSNE
jgi:two-component system osmolarity sensor histidine kinase EnvZ